MASTAAPSAGLKTRLVRQIERPRPLLKHSVSLTSGGQRRPQTSSHSATSAEETAVLLDKVRVILSAPEATAFDKDLPDLVLGLNAALKTFGPAMEKQYKDKMDQTMVRAEICKRNMYRFVMMKYFRGES